MNAILGEIMMQLNERIARGIIVEEVIVPWKDFDSLKDIAVADSLLSPSANGRRFILQTPAGEVDVRGDNLVAEIVFITR